MCVLNNHHHHHIILSLHNHKQKKMHQKKRFSFLILCLLQELCLLYKHIFNILQTVASICFSQQHSLFFRATLSRRRIVVNQTTGIIHIGKVFFFFNTVQQNCSLSKLILKQIILCVWPANDVINIKWPLEKRRFPPDTHTSCCMESGIPIPVSWVDWEKNSARCTGIELSSWQHIYSDKVCILSQQKW